MSDVEVVVVLGKGLLTDGSLPIIVRHNLDYANQQGLPIICTGGRWGLLPDAPTLPEATVMAEYLAQPVFTETQSKDTIGNLLLSKQIIDQHGWRTVEFVTSVDHLPRVHYIAERVFHNGYHLQYHGHDHVMTAQQWLRVKRYEWLSKCYDRWVLRKLPNDLSDPLTWLQQHHLMYSKNLIRDFLRIIVSRPTHR